VARSRSLRTLDDPCRCADGASCGNPLEPPAGQEAPAFPPARPRWADKWSGPLCRLVSYRSEAYA
jgi:hypothetical protein